MTTNGDIAPKNDEPILADFTAKKNIK